MAKNSRDAVHLPLRILAPGLQYTQSFSVLYTFLFMTITGKPRRLCEWEQHDTWNIIAVSSEVDVASIHCLLNRRTLVVFGGRAVANGT